MQYLSRVISFIKTSVRPVEILFGLWKYCNLKQNLPR